MASEAEVGHQRHVPDPKRGVCPGDVSDALVVIGGTIHPESKTRRRASDKLCERVQ